MFILKLKIIVLTLSIMLICSISVIASPNINQLMSNTSFSPGQLETVLDNGITIKITEIIPGYIVENLGPSYYTSVQGLLGIPYTATVDGVKLSIKNPTDKVAVVKWSESAFSIGSFSGIPFLNGMRYQDAGNPSATPDTLIPPGQTIEKNLFVSTVKFGSNLSTMQKDWQVQGIPIRRDGTTKATVTMKLFIDNGQAQYYNLTSPAITINK